MNNNMNKYKLSSHPFLKETVPNNKQKGWVDGRAKRQGQAQCMCFFASLNEIKELKIYITVRERTKEK